jgi:hypothetical protein
MIKIFLLAPFLFLFSFSSFSDEFCTPSCLESASKMLNKAGDVKAVEIIFGDKCKELRKRNICEFEKKLKRLGRTVTRCLSGNEIECPNIKNYLDKKYVDEIRGKMFSFYCAQKKYADCPQSLDELTSECRSGIVDSCRKIATHALKVDSEVRRMAWLALCEDDEMKSCVEISKYYLKSSMMVPYEKYVQKACTLGDKFSCKISEYFRLDNMKCMNYKLRNRIEYFRNQCLRKMQSGLKILTTACYDDESKQACIYLRNLYIKLGKKKESRVLADHVIELE